MPELPRRIVISASSDIGHALAADWLAAGCEVYGTFRKPSAATRQLSHRGARMIHCDLADSKSIKHGCDALCAAAAAWDVLVLAAGTIDPIGPFEECNFAEWADSFQVNFTGQMQVLRELLKARRCQSRLSLRESAPFRGATGDDDSHGYLGPLALLFAGGGANGAPLNYSAYTLAKIALTKAVELLAAEIADCRFAIVGPGWVNTKIHQATLVAGGRAGDNLRRTQEKIASGEWVPMDHVVECCNWLVTAPAEVISGRNFSTAFDAWGDPRLDELLKSDGNMYKLRRAGNEKGVRREAPGVRVA